MAKKNMTLSMDKLVDSPICDSNACYESEFQTQNGPVTTWLCLTSGFTTNTEMKEGEERTNQALELTADLIRENTAPLSSDASGIIESLKKILQVWETKQYPDDKTRWEEYYMDIEELVQDIEEEAWLDAPSINEQILRKIIRDEFEKLT